MKEPNERIKRLPQALIESNFVMAQALKKIGYSFDVQRRPQTVTKTKGYKMVMAPVIKRLEDARDRALDKLESKEKGADYASLVIGIDKLTKNMQLLTGQPTERINAMAELTDEQLNAILNAKEPSPEGTSEERVVPETSP